MTSERLSEIRTIRIQEKHGVCAVVAAMIVVYGMGSVEVGASWNPVRITVPERASVVRCVELATMFVKNCTSGGSCP